jgi:predicted amidohydrolase
MEPCEAGLVNAARTGDIADMARNLVPTLGSGAAGGLPAGWTARSPRPSLAPRFALAPRGGRVVLAARGNGRDDCVGHLATPVVLEGGLTYRLRVRIAAVRGLDLHQSVVVGVFGRDFNNGIFSFSASRDGFDGESRFAVPGRGPVEAEVRLTFRATARGSALVERISLEPCDLVPQRLVRVGCTQGQGTADEWAAVLDAAGALGMDLVLLPEMMNGTTREGMNGPSARLMAGKARQYSMYVAGGIYCYEKRADRLWNRTPLFDRAGRLVGRYDKVHPYSPEIANDGVTAGTEVPVFRADFGRVGIMICYDSWFTDVAELLALKGAEMILFPNADYYRSLMPARAADNGVRVVASSLYGAPGVWDTAGRDVQAPLLDASCHAREEGTFADPAETMVGAIRLLTVTLDFARSPSPHNWGGPLLSAPGGRRNRRDQRALLFDELEKETRRP